MSNKNKQVSKRELLTALENTMFSLALYAAGKGSVAEGYLQTELDKMSQAILKTLSTEGRLQLEAALEQLLKIEAAKVEGGTN